MKRPIISRGIGDTDSTSPKRPEHSVQLLTSQEAADLLRISLRKLWGLTADGKIPVVRIGGSVRYREASLEQWLRDLEQGGRSHE
jgi:excisionase family DNA binding protein